MRGNVPGMNVHRSIYRGRQVEFDVSLKNYF